MAETLVRYYGVDMLPFDGGEVELAAALRERGWTGVYEQHQSINVYVVKNRPGTTALGMTQFRGGVAHQHYLTALPATT